MADPATYRPASGVIPEDPGVYRFRDENRRVIYVGKAKNLRSRLNSYFSDLSALHPRTQQMVTTAVGVEWTVVGTEVEALQLEYTWIKEYDPRFNVKFRDDKSYPYLAITMGEEFPRAQVMRGAKKKGTRYFGPYSHAWAIRETLDILLRVFPMRTCATGVFRRAKASDRPCLLGYIDKCSAPCVGRVSAAEHREISENFADFLAGNTGKFVRDLEAQMQQAAADLEYEKAARLRDDLSALHKVMERNAVVLDDATDADVFALHTDELEAAVQVFHVREGRIRGQRGWVSDVVQDATTEDLVSMILTQVYGDGTESVPREVLVNRLPESSESTASLRAWLQERRGSKVDLRVPQRGDKATLMETVVRNAEQALVVHKTRRGSDLSARAAALDELHQALSLSAAPLRIECFDISHTAGTSPMASMVVFEDGLARKAHYRTFAITTVSNDDVGAMREVIERRMQRYLKDQETQFSDDEGAQRFAYPPNLLLIDGGAPQVAAAADVLTEMGITDVAVAGLAKRLEEVWLPGEDFPVILSRGSEGLFLLQRIRDEAHRFAITAHRKRRTKTMTASVLDDIPGLGPSKIKALREALGDLKSIKQASVEQLASVSGISTALAETIHAHLHSSAGDSSSGTDPSAHGAAEFPSAVDMTTGELLD